LDISANVDEEYLKKYDLKANDAILAEDKHIPIYKEISEKYEAEYIPGGATQNAIKIAQWHLGTPDATTFMGCIGKDDEFGKILETNTRKLGVNTIYQYDEKTPTGTAACLVTGNNRSLIANLAAANCFSKDHIDDEKNWAVIEKADFFYIAGFPLTVCPPAILKVAKHACEKKKTFMMNLSAPFICQFFKEPLWSVCHSLMFYLEMRRRLQLLLNSKDLRQKMLKKLHSKQQLWLKKIPTNHE